ncbi:uncharacterized protein NPIL_644521 [Nephila pilipes]|uniref:Uncharacterized protein n=1 Tax=Nephila pilipes TaxID=299642 RepID=A0A8X6PUR2_NEPPI|nr:uncharacterized protein NPIL_644521 [Nephila pilipes]
MVRNVLLPFVQPCIIKSDLFPGQLHVCASRPYKREGGGRGDIRHIHKENEFIRKGASTSVPSSSTSDNLQCNSTSNIFLEASRSEVRPLIPTDSEQNKGDDSEKGDNEEVQSNNESNRDRESEEDKDRPERFIDLDVEMLSDIAVWPTTLTDLMIDYIIRKKPNNIGNIETLKSVYKDRDQVYYRGLSYDHFYRKKTNGVKEERNWLPKIKKKAVQKLKDIYKDDIESFNFDDELDQFLLFLKENKDTMNTPIEI